MIVPDANLLLYAYDDRSAFRQEAREWWEGCLSGAEPVGLTPPTVFAFVRIATNARVFASPMTLDRAVEHVLSWLGQSAAQILQPPATHLQDVFALLREAGSAAGNLVSDAQIAAFAQSYRAVVHTADRDFLRFRSVRCHFPLDR